MNVPQDREHTTSELRTLCNALQHYLWFLTRSVLDEDDLEITKVEEFNAEILYRYFDDCIPHARTDEEYLAAMVDDMVRGQAKRLFQLLMHDAAEWEHLRDERQHRLDVVLGDGAQEDSFLVRHLRVALEEAEAGLHWARSQGLRKTMQEDRHTDGDS